MEFINNVTFEKNIKLKPLKKEKTLKGKKRRKIYVKLTRLVFFFLIIIMFFYGGRYALCSFISFCQGTPHQSWEEVKDSWKKFQENN